MMKYPLERRQKTMHLPALRQILNLMSTIQDGRRREVAILYRYKASICNPSILKIVNSHVFSERFTYLLDFINRKQRKNEQEIQEHKILAR